MDRVLIGQLIIIAISLIGIGISLLYSDYKFKKLEKK